MDTRINLFQSCVPRGVHWCMNEAQKFKFEAKYIAVRVMVTITVFRVRHRGFAAHVLC